ncbi:MAG: MBL fold metallo-hydrolase [Gammaproteobacteria bacterium]|nr:MBL fold metallo-hydrolase [Gammaproteobacteria bacterium]MDH3846882.1 MBL fold metallo-hydrolase [Gammaproteobacteria bacterium]MDH3864162.1 MBL fold metallo-hydrolase [Gammaproteobacteria bacterium]MDH3906382.1 MBL fold metallo-hydrolase [Gammaproteobacteria bacterium]MDH3907402.1 MBL fold metallo-hydrolase [Gammaproteobacteria bacterium]
MKPQYAFDSKPETGTTMPVADGIHWLRMPLPFDLDHINLWLLEDGGGWAIVDTGICTSTSKDIWRKTFSNTMAGRPVTHVIATHLHPDHLGCAGWLTRHFDVDLWMTREEYMLGRLLLADTGKPAPEEAIRFYAAAGFSEENLQEYRDRFGFFGRMVSRLPESYLRIHENDRLSLGELSWRALIGRGHSPAHACLYCEEQNLLISGDQVLPTISANVSVWPTEPAANPLKHWLESLAALRQQIPEDVLVLPAHGKPFRGAHDRIDALIAEHVQRLESLHEYLGKPCRAIDTFEILYRRRVPGTHRMMATGEAIAHLNYLVAAGDAVAQDDADGVIWFARS